MIKQNNTHLLHEYKLNHNHITIINMVTIRSIIIIIIRP